MNEFFGKMNYERFSKQMAKIVQIRGVIGNSQERKTAPVRQAQGRLYSWENSMNHDPSTGSGQAYRILRIKKGWGKKQVKDKK
jgi:hypothetical protein